MSTEIKAFFHKPSFTISYVIADLDSKKCMIIDSVLDYDAKSGRTSTEAANEIVTYITDSDFELCWILETHVHADHLSAAPYIKSKLGGEICIGAGVPAVQKVFKKIFNAEIEMPIDGSQFDRLLSDQEEIHCGSLKIQILASPGHTPACVSYVVENAIFVGDTLFMHDFGTARCDFPGGDASALYKSIRRILSYSEDTRLFMCHDYGPGGRDFAWETTVKEQREKNIHIKDGISEAEFIEMRETRDQQLDMPALILPSVQINMRAGHFPKPESNGISYMKIPINAL